MKLLKKLLLVLIIGLTFVGGCFGHEEGRHTGLQRLEPALPAGGEPAVEEPAAGEPAMTEEEEVGILRYAWDRITSSLRVGLPKWRGARMYGGPEDDKANAMAVNSEGIIYIAGSSGGKALLLAYSPDGDLLWDRKEFSGEAMSVLLDDENNIYIIGNSSVDLHGEGEQCGYKGGRDLFVAKYKPDGNFDWVCQFGTPNDDFARGAVIDPYERKEIYMIESSGARPDAIVLSFSVDSMSRTPIESFITPKDDFPISITISGRYIYVAGVTNGCLDGTFVPCNGDTKTDFDIFFAKIDKRGELDTFKKQFGTRMNDWAPAIGVEQYGEFNVFIAGVTEGSFDDARNRGTDWFIQKYNDAATELWKWQFHYPKDDNVNGLIMYFDGRYEFFIVFGDTNCEALTRDSCDILVAKYNFGGYPIWLKRLGTQEDREDVAKAAAVSPDNKFIYVAGNTFGDMDSYKNQGNSDIFLIRLKASDGEIQ
jgi:hypothetical protein